MKSLCVVLAIAMSVSAQPFQHCVPASETRTVCMNVVTPFRVCIIEGRPTYTPSAALCPCKDKNGKQCVDKNGQPRGGEELLQFTYQCEHVARLPHCNPPAAWRQRNPFSSQGDVKFGGEELRRGWVRWKWTTSNGAVAYVTPKFWAPEVMP